MEFFKKLYFGHFGLGKTYWFGFVGVGIFNYILNVALTRYYWFVSESNETIYEQLVWVVGLFQILATLYFAIAVFNAAKINGKRSIWGWLATIAVFIAFVRIVFALFSSFTNTYLTWSQLEEEIKVINTTLPAQIDTGVTMIKVIADESTKSVTYFYSENEAYAQYDLQKASEISKQNMLESEDNICSDLTFLSSGLVETVTFNYTGTDGESFNVVFRQQDCP